MKEEFSQELKKLLQELKERLKNIRGYRISLGWLQEYEIEAYGRKLPLKSISHIVQLDPLSFRLEPWDENIIAEIERSLRGSKVNLQVYKEGKTLIVKFPPLTEELKRDLLKSLHQLKEEFRIKSRQKRDEVIKNLNSQKEKGSITEDDFYREKKKIDEEIEKFNTEVENLFIQKEKEIL
jgi:ribosome recycling factor